ncbi:MAG: site-specific integrase [Cellulomonadaceae bacterium]|nr:site-specific integrase [Cellulomonadaceae bacterium]
MGSIEAGYTASGSRRRISVTAKTEAECKRRLRDKQRKIDREGLPSSASADRVTVKAWVDVWLPQRERVVRPKTFATDASTLARWIVPTIGHKRLATLSPADRRAVMTAMEDGGLELSSLTRCHMLIGKMLTDAVAEGYSVPQRVREVPSPGMNAPDRDALAFDDALAILAVASKRPDASRWVAAMLQGVRPAEARGLPWDMVNFEADEITLAWQLQALPYKVKRDPSSGFRVPRGYEARQVDGALHLVRPKTRSGWRVVPMVPWMRTSLLAWREIAPESPYGLVWPQADGRPRRDGDDRAAWHAITDAAHVAVTEPNPVAGGPEVIGRRPDLYEARHTAATLLRAAKVDDATITAILGHATILSTKAYLHTDHTRKRRALESVAETLGLTT